MVFGRVTYQYPTHFPFSMKLSCSKVLFKGLVQWSCSKVLFKGLVQRSCSKVLFNGLDERVAMSQLCDVCQPVILLDLRDTSSALCRWTEQKLVTTTPLYFFCYNFAYSTA